MPRTINNSTPTDIYAERDQLAHENTRLLEEIARLRTASAIDTQRIEQQLVYQRAIQAWATLVNAELNLSQVLNLLLKHLQDVFKADGVVIFLRPPGTYGFRYTASHGLSRLYIDTLQQSYLNGPPGIAISQRVPVIIEDALNDIRMGPLSDLARIEGVRSLVKLPCVFRDEVVGFLGLHHRTSQTFSEFDKALMQSFADQAAVAIKNAQLHQTVVEGADRLNTVLEAVSEPLVAYTTDYRILLANRPFYDLIGCDAAHLRLEGMSLAELRNHCHSDGNQEVAAMSLGPLLERAQRNPGSYVELELTNPWRVYQLTESLIRNADGQPHGFLVIYHDVTHLRENQRLKDELVAVLSHELRTPLTSILGYAKLLADRPHTDAERRTKWANFILAKSRILSRMIDEVLDLSRLSMRRFTIHPQPADLVGLIHRVVDEVGIATDKHTFQVESPLDVPPVNLDDDRMSQVFINLLDNAVKYWPQGGVILIQIALDKDPTDHQPPTAVQISVIDHGPGIPLEHHERIFEPFYRVDNKADRQAYGLGLGLALCKGIVDAHGGQLSLSKTPGGGSTFTVTLPMEQASPH